MPTVTELLARATTAATSDGAAELLRAACGQAVRDRRVDLLIPVAHRVRALRDGVDRHCALAIVALASGEIHAASKHAQDAAGHLGAHCHDSETVLLVRCEIALAAAALGQWMTVLEQVDAGRVLLATVSSTGLARQCGFDLAGLAALAECHTLSGTTELGALKELIAPVRARNALTAEHALAMVCLGSVQHTRGRWGEAALDLRRGIALTPPFRAGVAAHAAIELCLVRVRQGRWGDADDAVRHLTSTFEAVDSAWLDPQILAVRGLMFAIRGDTETAAPVLEHAALLAREYPTVTVTTVLLHADICVAITVGDWTQLRRILDDAEDLPYRRPYSPAEWRALRLLAAWHLGNAVEFRRRLTEWGAQGDAEDSAYYWAFLSLQAESEGRHDDGTTAIRTSLERVGDDDDPLGRAWVSRIADAHLTRRGGDGQIDPAEVLTEQQLRIARLVADGYTSAEIGDITHLSRKTVDFHVANILRRLDLTHRREIIRLIRP